MSMIEALERGPESTERSRSYTIDELQRYYKQETLEEGTVVLKKARVQELLGELGGIIGQDFSDVRIDKETLYADGSVGMSVSWDFRALENTLTESSQVSMQECKRVMVCALPITQELIVAGGENPKLVTFSQWAFGRPLEDAIVGAYRNPLRWLERAGRVI